MAFYRLLYTVIEQGNRSLLLLTQYLAEEDKSNLALRNMATSISRALRRAVSFEFGDNTAYETTLDLEKFIQQIRSSSITQITQDENIVELTAKALYQAESHIQNYYHNATNITFTLSGYENETLTFTCQFTTAKNSQITINFTVVNLYEGSKSVTCIAEIATKLIQQPAVQPQSSVASVSHAQITESLNSTQPQPSSRAVATLLQRTQNIGLSGPKHVERDSQQYATPYTKELIGAIQTWGKQSKERHKPFGYPNSSQHKRKWENTRTRASSEQLPLTGGPKAVKAR